MKKELEQALEQVRRGAVAGTAETVSRIKALPRDAEGVFDVSGAADVQRLLYPVYAAYETNCNRKEGYPDILRQMRVMDRRLQERYDAAQAAIYMDMSLHTLMYMSQEIYECYRELMDLYKKNVRRFIREFGEDGELRCGETPGVDALALFRESLALACRERVLLAEKYEMYCEPERAGKRE